MTLRCSSCGALLEPDGAFPSAIVRCRFCGGSTVVPSPSPLQRAEANPYRTPGHVSSSARTRSVRSSPPGGAPCPRCGKPLADAAPFGVDMVECSRCGVFTSHDSLAALLAQTPRDSGPAKPPPGNSPTQAQPPREFSTVYLRCPQCNGAMNRSRFSLELPFVIDVCMHHGIWFDSGEMQHALAFAARGGHYDPTKHRGLRRREPMALATSTALPAVGPASDGPVLDAIDGVELLGDLLSVVVCWWAD